MSAPNKALPVLDPVHDGRHQLRDLPLERESMPYIIALPQHGIATCIYTWVNKDNEAGALFVACGPAIGDEPLMEVVDGIDVAPHADFDNWKVGPVRLTSRLDFSGARIHARGERMALDVNFAAMHPAYAYSFHPDGCPDYAATDRIEQACRVTGSITVDNQAYGIDTTGARDHSWGTRDWHRAQHWKWIHAQSTDTAVHVWQILVAGRIDLRGFVYRDGQLAAVESADINFASDSRFRQKTIRVDIVDAAGRKTRLAGEYFGHFAFEPADNCVLVEGGMACTINDQIGTGWSEFMWPVAYLNHLVAQQTR